MQILTSIYGSSWGVYRAMAIFKNTIVLLWVTDGKSAICEKNTKSPHPGIGQGWGNK